MGQLERISELSTRQQIIMGGLLLFVISCMFPPFEGRVLRSGDNPTVYMGHRLIFMPPTNYEIGQVYGRQGRKTQSHILFGMLFVQTLVIVAGTVGAVLLHDWTSGQSAGRPLEMPKPTADTMAKGKPESSCRKVE
jgi:hypothetical protein